MTTEYTPNFGLAKPDFRMGPWHDLINGNADMIDALLFSALSNTNVVAWENATAYASGVSVVDNADATIWLCVIAHTSAAAPTTFAQDRVAHPTFWTQLIAGFAPRGEWTNSTNYFPYDLAYSSDEGIFAICAMQHTSNVSGTLKDDEAFWSFLMDFSDADVSTALAVTYNNGTSGLTATDVQNALDELAARTVALDGVNVTQGAAITALQGVDVALDSRLDAVEATNTTQDAALAALDTRTDTLEATVGGIGTDKLNVAGGQTTTGGFAAQAHNHNTFANFTANMLTANYQYGVNNGGFTITAPTTDGGVDIMVTNGATAGGISFSGFTVAAGNTGDPLTTTNGHKFLISIRRIGGTATYAIKALQ